MTTAARIPAETLVLDVPTFDPRIERIHGPEPIEHGARAIVRLRAAQEELRRARIAATEAADALAAVASLHGRRQASPSELALATAHERVMRQRVGTTELRLMLASDEVNAATRHVRRIAIAWS